MTKSDDLYLSLLEAIGDRAEQIGPRPLTSHWPHVGSAAKGLIIAGQALHGWDRAVPGPRWQASEVTTLAGRRRILRASQTWFRGAAEPIGVIATLPNRRNTPFWQLSRGIVQALEPGAGHWYSHYAWANAYPVGFDAGDGWRQGSPSGPLKEAQDSFVGPLFLSLIEMLGARRVVVICGPGYWWPLGGMPPLVDLARAEFPLIKAGRAGGRTWVVGYHPTYARRRGVTASAYLDLVLETVKSVESGVAA